MDGPKVVTTDVANHKPVNFLLMEMEAVAKDQSTLQTTEIGDAQTAKLDANIETMIYEKQNKILHDLSEDVQNASTKGQGVTKAQNAYSVASTKANSEESQADGAVRSSQGQTDSDSKNLNGKAMMAQGVASILTTTQNLLARY